MLDAERSIFESDLPLATKLERARTELLDLSARNRLLNVPRFSKSAKTIDVVDERSAEIFRLLAKEGRALTFLAGRPDRAKNRPDEEDGDDVEEEPLLFELAQPGEDDLDERGLAKRHSDTAMQTRMTPSGLQKRLLDLYHDARTLEEEQGVNILFLALGTLRWIDPNNKENVRYAPLVLIPVRLERGSAGERFRLRARPEDLTANLSLEAYLDRVHALALPPFETGEEFDAAAYMTAVSEAVVTKEGWGVQPDDIVLGFFSFAKFLMYRDLDPETWPVDGRITDQTAIRALLSDGFEAREPLLEEDAPVDQHILPKDMLHIVDSDSSQTLAVHEVRRGRDLVIQGPPGTGKSQTIANVIASAVADGRTVLFVAEKMAALDVVKRRLDAAGVGDACLELHSNKANKRTVLDELRRTWELGSPRGEASSSLAERLREARDSLNAHVDRMHAVHEPSGLTPFQVIGQMVRLRREGQRPVDFDLDAVHWGVEGLSERCRLLAEVSDRVGEIGRPINHPWHGVGLDAVLPTTLERLVPRIEALLARTEAARQVLADLSQSIEMEAPSSPSEALQLAERSRLLAAAPDLSPEALASPVWEDVGAVRALLAEGSAFDAAFRTLASRLTPDSLDTPIPNLISTLDALPSDLPPEAFAMARSLTSRLPRLVSDAHRLAKAMGLEAGEVTLATVARCCAIAGRVAEAPRASPEAFVASVWDDGIEQVGHLGEALAALEAARNRIGDRLLDVAWNTDVAASRQALATHTGLLKSLSGDWRRANALVRSLLKDPLLSVAEAVMLLDVLMAGQAAAARVRAGEALGREALGTAWAGERTSSAQVLGLVGWMRTLDDLGSEPRRIAAHLSQRSDLGPMSAQLGTALEIVKDALQAFWGQLGPVSALAQGNALSLDRVSLDRLQAMAVELAESDALSRSVLSTIPASLTERISDLRGLADLQVRAARIDAQDDLGQAAFGEAWEGRRSAWIQLTEAVQWTTSHGDLRHLAARISDRPALAAQAEAAVAAADALVRDADALLASLRASPEAVLAAPSPAVATFAALAGRLQAWLDHPEQLSKWVAYRERADRATRLGLGPLIERLVDGRLAPDAAGSAFEIAAYEAILDVMIAADPEVGRFDGTLHSTRVRDFATLDLDRIQAARLEVVRAHHRRIPPRDGNLGPLSVLRGEMARKRGHMPIRSLMQRAGPAIQALKPVMMMSPLSVAQFLTPGRMSFDLLVMDEASQIHPVDALGAIARARQVVVVGDERQLPPTRFFSKMTGGAPDEDDEGAQVADVESILGLFVARGLPQRMLRWHYRSRHQSLIAVSNSQFYQNRLFIVPSPYTAEAGMGLRFTFVEGGVFDSGGSGTNVVEARAVARAVMAHARSQPERSLGVATFSVSQRRAIQDELELLRRADPETEEFFRAHPAEPFFVKNLENVQGDERDVIIISVGYARNAQGYMAMRFGPLGAEGGERRLNVLISRAKRRCEVFASITDEDIDLERAKGKGVVAFKLFLHYARTGRISLAQATGRPMDSVFEEQVAAALQERGYQIHPQVGIAGFFIDLAVADPERPGRYLLGIECDGASYHSSRSARDRDRLRQAVLEDHGWIIHRIWSTDWFQRPQESLERVVAAIEAAKVELDARMEAGLAQARSAKLEVTMVDRGDLLEYGLSDVGGGDEAKAAPNRRYVEAVLTRPGPYELHETPVGVMASLVEEVVTVESPVHVDEVMARIREAWDLKRAGGRIQDAVMAGVTAAVGLSRIEQRGDVLSRPGMADLMRNRSDTRSAGLRRPEAIPPSEIAAGVLELMETNLGATEAEAVQAVARGLGFKATSAQLRAAVVSVIRALEADGRVVRRAELLSVVQPEEVAEAVLDGRP